MISGAELRRRARELGVRLTDAEKNYVNSWILWAIYASSDGDNLLFKGGTVLSKLYFPETWRYSEDLDFGVDRAYHGFIEQFMHYCNRHRPHQALGESTPIGEIQS